jgi:alpha-beta hydrolase superfamily lysophospholipase
MPVRNMQVGERLRHDLIANRVHEKLQTPFIMLLGGQDLLVDNKGSHAFSQSCSHPHLNPEDGREMKKIVEYEDLTHMMIHDANYIPDITTQMVKWFDTHRE